MTFVIIEEKSRRSQLQNVKSVNSV